MEAILTILKELNPPEAEGLCWDTKTREGGAKMWRNFSDTQEGFGYLNIDPMPRA
jgi:hypothetical protein